MFMLNFSNFTASISLLALAMLVGCGQQETATTNGGASPGGEQSAGAHDPHDVSLTEEEIAQLKADTARYADAIDHIEQYQATIQQETTTGEPAKAHRALDHLDIVLNRLPEAARDSGVPKERWQELNETAQQLRDLFNQVHANIDDGQKPNYEAVAEEINQGIKTLSAIEPQPSK